MASGDTYVPNHILLGGGCLSRRAPFKRQRIMGPITLFDKSFLQSLSLDESFWFDHFFLTNVCPLFYNETLADLHKSVEGRTPEREVGIIADKFPEAHGSPSALHANLVLQDLLGHAVPMTGQIPHAGGRPVETNGKLSSVFEISPEAEAFSRWRNGEFREVERLNAQFWKHAFSALDSVEVADRLRLQGIDAKSCRSLEEARALAASVASGWDQRPVIILPALLFLNIPWRFHSQIIQRWIDSQCPPLAEFAPYAAYVMTVEIFLQTALAANLISSERPSSRIDIRYLFYLPFCMMFVSSDRLHERCAALFLRDDQGFVWGQELKKGLGEINGYYLQLPESTRDKGVYSFAADPPEIGNRIVVKLWDQFIPKWREKQDPSITPVSESNIKEEIRKMEAAPTLPPNRIESSRADMDQVVIKRKIRRKRGSWYQVPKNSESQEKR